MALIGDPFSHFLAQVAAIVLVSRLLGAAVRWLHQPMVVAEIAAGIVLGPSLLGALWPEVGGALFARDSLAVLQLVSQFGLILFMFLVGLHLDPAQLAGRAGSSVVISYASIAVPFALGVGLALWQREALVPPQVSLVSVALFMGAGMSITAFPVLARILAEQRLLQSRLGTLAIGSAAVGDATAWCILAFVAAVARASGMGGAAATTVLTVGYVGAMLGAARPLVERIAARVANPEGMTHNALAVTLLLLLASSWATEQIGIHALFGAFLFGAILPKEGGFARVLAEKIEDLVIVLLLPLFFAYSGVRTELGLLDTAGEWALCGLIIAVACLGKFGGGAVAARLTGLSLRESVALGVLLNTRGLMELVVLNIGLDLGVITPTVFTMMVLMALVTTAVTTPLLQWILPPVPVEPEPARVEPAAARERFGMVVCVAYDRSGPGLLRLAAALCGTARSCELHALHLVRPTERGSFYMGETPAQIGAAALAPLLEEAEDLGVSVRPISLVSSDPAHEIGEVARVKAADLILLGWHKPVLGETYLGGTVYRVMQETPADVGVFLDRGVREIRRLLVPYLAGSPHDRAALALAGRVSETAGAQIVILHVVRPGRAAGESPLGVREQAEQVFATQASGSVALRVVEHASPVDAVLQECGTGYDLVVVGMDRDWGLQGRLFSVQGERLMLECPSSMLVVRGGGAGDRSLRPR
jgi:Kef-type K+ transport system membrane component KefB/nucleotide-binding universal stress UspA family protein